VTASVRAPAVLDQAEASDFRNLIREAQAAGCRRLVVDLVDTTFIGMHSIHDLVDAAQDAKRIRGWLCLARPAPRVLVALRMANVRIEIFDTLAEALGGRTAERLLSGQSS
jgi:anti-anti-sigma regulatory factor